jgi:hypothetical protein
MFFVWLNSCNCFCSFVAILEKREEVKICYDFEKRLSLENLLQFGQEGGASLSLSIYIIFLVKVAKVAKERVAKGLPCP